MKKYENFCKALENLQKIYCYEESYGIVELTGMVGLYEVCFEQAWKLMKMLLERDGFVGAQTGSPRQIMKLAYQAGLVTDESLWLAALNARSNVAHAYNQDIALQIVAQTKAQFFAMFTELKQKIEAEWL